MTIWFWAAWDTRIKNRNAESFFQARRIFHLFRNNLQRYDLLLFVIDRMQNSPEANRNVEHVAESVQVVLSTITSKTHPKPNRNVEFVSKRVGAVLS